MRRFLILFLFTQYNWAQLSKKEILSNPYNDCARTKNLSFNKLSKLFPLNKATKIQIISFENVHRVYIDSTYREPEPFKEGIPIYDGNKLNVKKTKEVITLNFTQIAELSDLLYNYNTKTSPKYASKDRKCYEPRNGILYLNDKDEILEYIEICFSCRNYKVFTKSNLWDFCEGKMELLETFFLNNGIQFGPNFRY
ncbi:hypothetical protein [Flavobacterium sp.]|uniref:hypothetical protein n=1 Tax=Flavobacterium sp. TaxID=239 RepID=UPI003D0BA13E